MSTSDLSAFELYALQWDERGASVTASFEGHLDDEGRRAREAPPEHDWIRFHLRFAAVDDLEVRGWSHQLPTTVEQTPAGDRMSVSVTGAGTAVRFTAEPPVEVDHRTSKAGAI